jgi:hypothetical protein
MQMISYIPQCERRKKELIFSKQTIGLFVELELLQTTNFPDD